MFRVSLSVAILFFVIAPAANARVAKANTHAANTKKSHPLRALVNAVLPDAGVLAEDDNSSLLSGPKYELRLVCAATGEMVDVVYRVGNTYIPGAVNALNLALRDSHNEEVADYDPRTFDLLYTVLEKLGKSTSVVNILSGYRSQETNDMLRASGTTNAAEFSQHIYAKAMDIRVPGVSAAMLRNAALSLDAGGVGYYPRSQFVHIDVGPVRHWTYTPHVARRHRSRSRRARA